MTYSYYEPLTYGTQQPLGYDGMTQKKPSSWPYGVGGLVIGAAAGGIVGSRKNPFVSKDGAATDSFAKKVSDKVVDKAPDAEKKIHTQRQKILNSINDISTTDELKNLFSDNKEAVDKVFSDSNEFMKNVTEENLANSKKTIKEKFVAEENTFIQDVKNNIQACWKKDGNKFEKADSVKQEVFDAIQESIKGTKTKLVAKYAAITGLVTGAIAFIAHKIITNKKASEQHRA